MADDPSTISRQSELDSVSCVLFHAADRRWGALLVDLHRVIERIEPPIPVPVSPAWLLGVVACDADVATVIDLDAFLSGSPPHVPREGFTLIAQHASGLMGLRVERSSAVWQGVRVALPPEAPAIARSGLAQSAGSVPLALLLDFERLGDAIVTALEKELNYRGP
jgi:chemotaxis signal transduction protein